jgi:hypothetical protein
LILGIVLEQRQQHADLQILVGQLLDFGYAMGDENGIASRPWGFVYATRLPTLWTRRT